MLQVIGLQTDRGGNEVLSRGKGLPDSEIPGRSTRVFKAFEEKSGIRFRWNPAFYYCRLWEMGENPSPISENFNMFEVWRIIENRAVEVVIEIGGGKATVSARFALEVMDDVFGESDE
jgi:hypothetical protein